MLSLKYGVNVRDIKGEAVIAIIIAQGVYAGYGFPCVITSVDDRNHGEYSLHYQQLAIDVRTRIVPENLHEQIKDAIARSLGEQYDVVLEKDHIHIEFDPD